MTSSASSPASRLLRRLATLVVLASGAGLALAAPASADVPEGWSDPAGVDPFHAALVVVGIPVGLALIFAAIIYLPPLLRGESVAPGAPQIENQWLGGPRKSVGELAAPDGEESQAGGASARW